MILIHHLKRIVLIVFLFFTRSYAIDVSENSGNILSLGESGHATRVIDSLKAVLHTSIHDTARISSLYLLADKLCDQNTSEALKYGLQALTLSDSILYNPGKANAYKIIGCIYMNKADYKIALDYFLQALRLYEKLNDKRGIVLMHNNLGIVYHRLKRNEIARKYYMESLRIIKENGFHKDLSMIYNNLGNVAKAEGHVPQSIGYYKTALELGRNTNNDYSTCVALMNLGEIYLDIGQLDTSGYYFNLVFNLKLGGAADHYIAGCHYALGKIALKKGLIDQAEHQLLLSKQIAEKAGIKNLLLDISEDLAHLYIRKKDYRTALDQYMLFHAMSDSVFNETTARMVNELQAGYQMEKKDKQIQLLNKDKQIVEANANKDKVIRNFFIVAFIFIFIFSINLIRNVVLKQRINKILSDKNEQIELQKQQIENDNRKLIHENIIAKYEVLKSKTNPHFLFNSLSTLSSIVVSDPDASLEFIERFSELYRMILETGDQRLISLKQEMVVVDHYLYLQKVRFGKNIIVDMPFGGTNDQFLPPFSIQMVIENAIKHNIISSDEKLKIKISIDHDEVIIRNNLQKKLSKATSTSIGQKNIIGRYKLLSDQQPVFTETLSEYIVKLPLLKVREEKSYELYNN